VGNVPLDTTPPTPPGTPVAGELITVGDLTFKAAQVYPVSGVDITLKSLAKNGTISFLNGGTADALPLSVGGQLTVSAANIVQGGTLRAPLGVIRLGAQTQSDLSSQDPDPRLVATTSVRFLPGSTTSVSLAGQTVPFGETANGSSWSYNSLTGQPLAALP